MTCVAVMYAFALANRSFDNSVLGQRSHSPLELNLRSDVTLTKRGTPEMGIIYAY